MNQKSRVLCGRWGEFCLLGIFLAVCLLVPVEDVSAKSCLWRVQKDGKTMYLLGSIHIFKETLFPFNPEIEQAYSKSDKLVFETDIEGEANLDIVEVEDLMFYTRRKKLMDDISKETMYLLHSRLPEIGIALVDVQYVKPWFVNSIISGAIAARHDYKAAKGIDQYFYDRATFDKKPIEWFEAPGFGFKLISGFDMKTQDAMLMDTLKTMDDIDKTYKKMMKAWKRGDLETLKKMFDSELKLLPSVDHELLTKRNRSWMPQIEKYATESGVTMIIVGTAHLIGTDNLLDTLKGKGWTIEQL